MEVQFLVDCLVQVHLVCSFVLQVTLSSHKQGQILICHAREGGGR